LQNYKLFSVRVPDNPKNVGAEGEKYFCSPSKVLAGTLCTHLFLGTTPESPTLSQLISFPPSGDFTSQDLVEISRRLVEKRSNVFQKR
jgi:hypothetical protein